MLEQCKGARTFQAHGGKCGGAPWAACSLPGEGRVHSLFLDGRVQETQKDLASQCYMAGMCSRGSLRSEPSHSLFACECLFLVKWWGGCGRALDRKFDAKAQGGSSLPGGGGRYLAKAHSE